MMKFYVAMGTYEYLKKVKKKHEEETLLFLQGDNTCLLLHETKGSSLFKQPFTYEVLNGSRGLAPKKGFAVLHYIPVSEEGRPLFEYRFRDFSGQMTKVPGFLASRVLRPLASDTYCLLTLWKKDTDFKAWRDSLMFEKLFSFQQTKKKKKEPQVFPRPSYMRKYSIVKEEE